MSGSAGAPEVIGEFERIRRFFAPLAGPGGLGLLDDAALVRCPAGQRLVMTADAMVAGVHFRAEDPPELIAKKLLRVNLSDLAAMGARPLYYLLTTALSVALGAEWVESFARGLGEDQRFYGVHLLGGDSVSTTGPATLSLTAIGEVAAGAEIRRSGARPGDDVWVSGTIGDAYLGLRVLRDGAFAGLGPAFADALVTRYQRPEPRTRLGPRLSGIAHAMIDVSDGLLADLGHICETSGCAATVALPEIPFSPAALAILAEEWDNPVSLMTGGDDYELLFCAPPSARGIIAEVAASLALQVARIGQVEAGAGVRLVDAAGREVAIETTGYRHF